MRVLCGVGLVAVIAIVADHGDGWHVEKCSTQIELVRTVAVREQTIMANAMKAIGKDVQQEAAHELAGFELS